MPQPGNYKKLIGTFFYAECTQVASPAKKTIRLILGLLTL